MKWIIWLLTYRTHFPFPCVKLNFVVKFSSLYKFIKLIVFKFCKIHKSIILKHWLSESWDPPRCPLAMPFPTKGTFFLGPLSTSMVLVFLRSRTHTHVYKYKYMCDCCNRRLSRYACRHVFWWHHSPTTALFVSHRTAKTELIYPFSALG